MPEEEKERSDPLLEHADAINEIVAKHYQLRVALNLIPVVGGSLSELFGGRGSQILEERRDRLLRSLSEQMQDLDERTVRKDHFETEEGFDLLSMTEVSQELGMGKSWVYQRIRSGEIPSVKLGRNIKVRREDLEGYVEAQRYR